MAHALQMRPECRRPVVAGGMEDRRDRASTITAIGDVQTRGSREEPPGAFSLECARCAAGFALPKLLGGRLINAYAEQLGGGASAQAIIRRAPGLRAFCDTLREGFRGGIYVSPYLYIAYENVIVTINATGAVSTVGTFNGADPVSFARNNKVPVADILAVSQDGTFVVTSTSITPVSDPDLPPNLIDICSVDSYFVGAVADGRMVSSGLNAITWNALDTAKAESNPDGLAGDKVVSSRRSTPAARPPLKSGPTSATRPASPSLARRSFLAASSESGPLPAMRTASRSRSCSSATTAKCTALSGYQEAKISPSDLDWLIQQDPSKGTS